MSSPILDRKLVQWTLGYCGGAWLVLEATGELADILGWSPLVQLTVLILLVFGLPIAIIIAWFHGERGAQRVTRTEITLLSVVAVAGLAAAYGVARSTPLVLSPLGRSPAPMGGGDLDPNRFAVFPLRGPAGDTVFDLALLVHDAMARWDGIELVDPALLNDVLDPQAGSIAYVEDARAASQRLSAGRLVLGEAALVGEDLRVRLELRDTRSGQVLADTTVRFPRGAAGADSVFQSVADGLLFSSLGLDPPDASGPGTASFPARVAYLRGMAELQQWRLAEAAALFEEAGRRDPEYARAHFRRAQALHWNGRGGPEVLSLAERAAAGRASLTEREKGLVDGLVRLERGEFARACDTYRALRDADDGDFAAWYGLGKCQELDRVVVPDPGSPTGWRFRSSYHRAAESYRRAFELLPARFRGFSSLAFQHVRSELFTSRSAIRVGSALPPSTDRFAAYPTLAGDTLAFIPYTIQDFGAGKTPGTTRANHWAAVERQRRVFRDLTAGWLAAFPESPEALQAYALTLDLLGDPATLDTLESARARTTDPILDRRLAMEAIPRMIKYAAPDDLDQLRRAGALADSLLREAGNLPPSFRLGAVGALRGRVFFTAEVERRAAEPLLFPVEVPLLVTAEAAVLSVYAAFGLPADSILHYEWRLVEAAQNRVPQEEQQGALHVLMDLPATLAYPTAPLARTAALAETTNFSSLRALAAYASGDREEARRWLSPLDVAEATSQPADKTPDVLLPEVWLALQLGDTLSAVAGLDAALRSLRWLEPSVLDNATVAAVLVRIMALRADLAHELDDPETAARWARAVAILWEDAAPPLQPLLSRMRTLARSSGRYADGNVPKTRGGTR